MTVYWRYWLFQVPGWIALAAVVAGAHYLFSLSLGGAAAILALWLLKDLALYPVLAKHYEPRRDGSRPPLEGALGVARQHLRPTGYVSVRGELWLARVEGESTVSPGEEVVVESVEGLKLRVRPRSPSAR